MAVVTKPGKIVAVHVSYRRPEGATRAKANPCAGRTSVEPARRYPGLDAVHEGTSGGEEEGGQGGAHRRHASGQSPKFDKRLDKFRQAA